MIKRSIKFILVAISCFSYSCSQNKNEKKDYISQAKTENNMTSQIAQQVNSFATRPYYSVDFDNGDSGCQFEILVNDVPVAKKIGIKGAMTSSAPINSCILQSGKQKLTVKLYPNVGKDMITTSDKKASPFNLSVTYRKDAWNHNDISEVTVFQLPAIILPESGLPYFEKEFEFDAEVPYRFEGWQTSKDLTKVSDIKQKVMNKFEEIKKLLEAKNFAAFAKMKNKKDIEMNTSFYLKPDEVAEGEAFEREAFTEKNAEVQPFTNAKVVFYGQGRLVTLENTDDKGSALRTKIKHISADGKAKEEVIKFPILFHIPKNSDELEIIR